MVVTNLMLCNVLYPLPTSRHLGSRPNNHYSRWRRRRFHPIDRPTRSTNVGAVITQQDLAGSFILLILAGATKSADWEGVWWGSEAMSRHRPVPKRCFHAQSCFWMRCGLLGPKRVITRGYFMGFCYQASVGGSGDFYNTLFPAAWFPARAFGHPRVSMVFFFSRARYDDLGDGCIF